MLHTRSIETVVSTLCRISRERFVDPFRTLTWPDALDPEQWFFSPELISIAGTPEYEALDEAQRKALSFWEGVNFFSLNIHGEKALIEGLARNLYLREDPMLSPYLHHFLDEENKHMIYFGRFCTEYAKKIYPDRKLVFPREHVAGEEEFLFFVKVMIFEEIVDVYNRRMGDDDRLVPIVREINRLHHVDEARHLSFGRAIVKWLFDRYAEQWSGETLTNLRQYIAGYLQSTWREYYNSDVYRDAGIADCYGVQERAYESTPARAHRASVTNGCVRYLINCGVLLEEPAP